MTLADRMTSRHSGMCACPAHEDSSPSLSVKFTEGKVLIHCFAGCQLQEVLDAAGLGMPDLFDDKAPHFTKKPKLVMRQKVTGWRGAELTRVCNELRERESAIATAEDPPDWYALEKAYQGKTELEYRHRRLNSKSYPSWEELWREGLTT